MGSKWRSFLSMVWDVALELLTAFGLEQGCHVDAAFCDMQILESGSWNTVRSIDRNPSIISSEKNKVRFIRPQNTNCNGESHQNSRCCWYLLWPFPTTHKDHFCVSFLTTAIWSYVRSILEAEEIHIWWKLSYNNSTLYMILWIVSSEQQKAWFLD